MFVNPVMSDFEKIGSGVHLCPKRQSRQSSELLDYKASKVVGAVSDCQFKASNDSNESAKLRLLEI